MNKQREKTEQGIERRVEKSRMKKIDRRKEQERTAQTDNNRFWNYRLDKHNINRKRGEIKIEWHIAVVCTINKICAWEISQETQVKNCKNCNECTWHSDFLSTTSLAWSLALHYLLLCFSQEKSLWWKEINTHTHSDHDKTVTEFQLKLKLIRATISCLTTCCW